MDFLDGVSFTVSLMEKPPPQKREKGRLKIDSAKETLLLSQESCSQRLRIKFCMTPLQVPLFVYVCTCMSVLCKIMYCQGRINHSGAPYQRKAGPFSRTRSQDFLIFPKKLTTFF